MKLTTLGRIVAFLNIIALPGFSIYALVKFVPSEASLVGCAWFQVCMGVFLALIEYPFLCSCSVYCVSFAKFMRPFTGFWISRALIHIGIAAGAFGIYCIKPPSYNDPLTVLVAAPIMLLISASLYLAGALWKREENPGGVGESPRSSPTTGGAAPPPAPGGFAAFFTRSVAKAAVANPGATAAVLTAAAPTAAQLAFGGGSEKSSYSLPGVEERRGSPTAQEEGGVAAPEKPSSSMFGGGSLFGGGSKAAKYGLGEEVDGSNPFLSS